MTVQPESRLAPSRRDSLLYAALVASSPMARTRLGERLWSRMWASGVRHIRRPVHTRLHGRRALLNPGHPYPAFMRRWELYNAPLVELVHQAALAFDRRVDVVDVGAAVGDTALLLLDRCAADVGRIICVEGDVEFLRYLDANIGADPRISVVPTLLSDDESGMRSLLRTHAGTASAQGTGMAATTTFDELMAPAGHRVDVLKVDTDGFDGRVLGGAQRVLAAGRPAVIFEWHPRLYEATGNDWRAPFEILDRCGYGTLVWFTKFGSFDHVQWGAAPDDVENRAHVCLSDTGPAPDWHYDVVALPDGSPISVDALAALPHARRTRRRR